MKCSWEGSLPPRPKNSRGQPSNDITSEVYSGLTVPAIQVLQYGLSGNKKAQYPSLQDSDIKSIPDFLKSYPSRMKHPRALPGELDKWVQLAHRTWLRKEPNKKGALLWVHKPFGLGNYLAQNGQGTGPSRQ